MRFLGSSLSLLAGVATMAMMAGCGSSAATPAASGSTPEDQRPTIAAASPYLAAIGTDLLGPARIIPLASPGMCPGHFDLRPSQIEELASVAVLLRFDFQNSLEEKLASRVEGLQVLSVSVTGGMCDPHVYEAACRQVADALVQRGILSPEQAEARLADIAARMRLLRASIKEQVADARLAGIPVVASCHQADFCRLLGLDVVATLTAADTARASTLDHAVEAGQRAGVEWIIANRPEGRRLADVVADRLGATVLVLDNFPESDPKEAFDRLVRANVRVLVEGVRP
ncbi:MAG: zinc ABC transporter substrate-binding protein [Pirellulales bacterium]|nr:zinc ABC transporter substrate-binding protein [Pirellulales bacterium]